MKKIFFSFLIAFLITGISSKATHLMGGQITVSHLGLDSTEVKLVVYRDTTGIPMDTSTGQSFLVYSDSTCTNLLGTEYFNFVGFSSIGNGVEEYIFTKTLAPSLGNAIYLSDSAAADYYIKWTNCCRNLAILNLTSPGSNNMELQTLYHVFGNSIFNSTPIFLNQPVTTAQQNMPWQYNPLPYDADGDSLDWHLDVPWDLCQTQCAGYFLPLGTATDPFTVDPLTGQITWTPVNLGNWNATVMVDEYRNGQLIGFIRRDMQIIVLDSTAFGTGNKPTITINNLSVADQQQFAFTIPADYNFNLISDAVDVDNNDLKFTIQGEPFILSTNPATSTTVAGVGTASASLNWMPNQSQVRDNAYDMALRMFEKNANSVFVKMYDITIQLKVIAAPQGVSETLANNAGLIINPVPANQFATLQFNSKENEDATISILDMQGRIVKSTNQKAKTGMNAVFLSTSELPNGFYMIHIKTNSINTSGKVVVKH